MMSQSNLYKRITRCPCIQNLLLSIDLQDNRGSKRFRFKLSSGAEVNKRSRPPVPHIPWNLYKVPRLSSCVDSMSGQDTPRVEANDLVPTLAEGRQRLPAELLQIRLIIESFIS